MKVRASQSTTPLPPVTRTPCHIHMISSIVLEHIFDKKGDNPMPSGGRRPGAGAPRGNRNRLRHGLASKYVQETLLPALVPYPDLHRWFLNFQRSARRNKKAQRGSSASIIETLIFISELPTRPSPPTLCPSGPQRQTGTRPQFLTLSHISLLLPYAYVNLHHPSPHPKIALCLLLFSFQASFNQNSYEFNRASIKSNQRSTKSNHPQSSLIVPQSSPIVPQSHPIPCQPMVNPTQSLPTLQPPTFPLLAYPSPVP